MDWNVVLAIVAVAAIFQLAFFWYYLRAGRRQETMYPSATSESSDGGVASGANQGHNRPPKDSDETVVACNECGFENHWEPTYTYCANCTTKLG